MEEILGEGRFLRLVRRDRWEYCERRNVTGIVVIVAVTDARELVLVEQERPAVRRRVIELPAGLAGDAGEETLDEAARRELFEETGYEASRWELLGEATPSPGLCSLGADPGTLLQPQSQVLEPLLESFVLGEMARQRGWTRVDHDLYHFRDRSGPEVDLVLEARDGRVAAVETKAAATVSSRDFAGIDLLHDRLGDAFAHGVVLHLGHAVQPFGHRRTALPVAAVWA